MCGTVVFVQRKLRISRRLRPTGDIRCHRSKF
jgi:hypothetical protein